MKPITHPNMKDVTVEGILHALADPVRAGIFAQIATSECARTCSNFLNIVENRTLPKSTLSAHFKVLREAGLIRSERKGVELHNTTRCAELKDRFGEMVGTIIAAYMQQQKKRKPKRN